MTIPVLAVDPFGSALDADGRSPRADGMGEAYLPLAMGMVLESARASAPAGAYRFDLPFVSTARGLLEAVEREGPGLCLFSSYVWSLDGNLAASRAVKAIDPRCLTIHGGPSMPRRSEASQELIEKHGHVDILVRGEGEATLADLLARPAALFGPRHVRDAALREIPGIVFRDADGRMVRTPDRELVRELDQLPSPYLSGLFDRMLALRRTDAAVPELPHAALETSRGCPYGCTFCDWGSATHQRIRTFGLQRVRDELVWLARHRIRQVFVADANFGMLPRDVEIAQFCAEVKKQYGYPKAVIAQYAKNGSRHLAPIFRLWQDAGIGFEAVIAIQTTDEQTLNVLHRANVDTARYVELGDTFRALGLPVRVHLMLGLPGQTLASWKKDLQACFERQETVQIFFTRLLPNSPMAEPEYVERHGIRTDESDVVVATTSFTSAEHALMVQTGIGFLLYTGWGILRYLLMHLQWDHGIRMIDFVHAHVEEVLASPEEHPQAWRLLGPGCAMRPLQTADHPPTQVMHFQRNGWGSFYAEVERFVVRRYGVERDEALGAVMAAQEAVMPRASVRSPHALALRHDVVAYVRRGVDAMRRGQAPDQGLAEFPPGNLVVTDTRGFNRADVPACQAPIGCAEPGWELSSPLNPFAHADGRPDLHERSPVRSAGGAR